MKIKQIKEQTGQMKVDDDTKNAIINLIDLKTENDMKEVLQKMEMFGKELKIVYWVIGIAMAIMLTIFALK